MSLSNDEVQVWCASLQSWLTDLGPLSGLLSPDEVCRAERFYRSTDREHFIARRGLLRVILGSYLEMDPAALRFSYGAHGKPELAAPYDRRWISFNLSRSRGLVLYAVAVGRTVGVDLEYVRPGVECEQISSWLFSAREHEAISALPEPERQAAFFRCWTRKEAYIKGTGRGMSEPLAEFDVSVAPDEPAQLLRIQGDPAAAGRWSLHDLDPADGYAAALVVEGHDARPICRFWTPEASPNQDAEAAGC